MRFKSPQEAEDYMIQEVIDNFDFIKCWQTMRHLNWTWGLQPHIPTIDELKVGAKQRIRDAIRIAKGGESSKSTYFSSSGGLKASAWRNKYFQIEGLQLEFVLTDWTSEGDY